MGMTDTEFMNQALSLAKKADSENEVPVGAVIVFDNKIVAQGWNQPIQTHDPSAHAEMIALRNAAKNIENYRLKDATLYVTLEPCAMCVGAMIHARVKRLVFGAWDKKTGAVNSVFQLLDDPRHNHAIEWRGGLLETECAAILKAFFLKRRVRL